MKTRPWMVVLGVASMSVASPASADTLDLKLGLWESTFTTNVSGMLVPEDQLKQMPPAQRERMEAMMKKQQADGPKTRTSRTCLTQEKLARAFEKEGRDEEKNCKRTALVSTRSRQEISIVCTGDKPRRTEWRMEATSRETAKGSAKVTSGTGSMTMDFTAKWVGLECGKAD